MRVDISADWTLVAVCLLITHYGVKAAVVPVKRNHANRLYCNKEIRLPHKSYVLLHDLIRIKKCSLREFNTLDFSVRVSDKWKFIYAQYKNFTNQLGFVKHNKTTWRGFDPLSWGLFPHLYLVILQSVNWIPLLGYNQNAFTRLSTYVIKS